MSLNTWYDKGLTTDQYIESLTAHKDGFMHVYENFKLPEDETFFLALKEKNLRVIILAEPWCGHCMFNIPVLFQLATKTEMPVRVLPRDENLELMDQYLTNGKSRSVPIFIFIDDSGKEVAKWGPIAEKTKLFADELKVNLPEKDAEDYDDKFKEFIASVGKEFRENADFWLASYEGMKQALENSTK